MNMAICIWAIMGSFTDQKLCMKSVTGTRNTTSSHAPARAWYPNATLSAPANAIIPERGTRSAARGTPCWAA